MKDVPWEGKVVTYLHNAVRIRMVVYHTLGTWSPHQYQLDLSVDFLTICKMAYQIIIAIPSIDQVASEGLTCIPECIFFPACLFRLVCLKLMLE